MVVLLGIVKTRCMGGFVKNITATSLVLFLFCTAPASANLLDDLEKEAREVTSTYKKNHTTLDPKTIAAGLKEALSVGVANGVMNVSKIDGYFGNQLIKILVPEKVQKITKVLRDMGFKKEVDRFELSMNRAAEQAAPKARAFFVDAIKQMTIQDAQAILRGGDTAATAYLKSKTHDKIYASFKPVIASAMQNTGVTRNFKVLMDKAQTIPLLKKQTVDLDHYVTAEALDGLFFMVGEEERKIRKDPAARVTKLLKKVFQ